MSDAPTTEPVDWEDDDSCARDCSDCTCRSGLGVECPRCAWPEIHHHNHSRTADYYDHYCPDCGHVW
jgi:hypothetical protein